MRVHLIRAVALLWMSGTLYVSFLLFSTKTTLQNINWSESKGHKVQVDHVKSTGTPSDSAVLYRGESKPVPYHSVNNYSERGWSLYNKYQNNDTRRLFPVQNDRYDRILNQIHNIPDVDKSKPPKIIFMRWGLDFGMSEGMGHFVKHQCPVTWCSLTAKEDMEAKADLVYYHEAISPVEYKDIEPPPRNPKQLSLWFALESPLNTVEISAKATVNWTATYRTESVLNAPYERFAYFRNFTGLPPKPPKNFAAGKTKKVAWFVSNCWAVNRRMDYAKELAKYIDVDIYGACGKLMCQRDHEECDQLLRNDYKFYLSFENSNCQDYITEKFFVNALKNDILPIVMGARPQDYERLAPPNSFIHVDEFDSPKTLAEYLHLLDKNDDLYNKYFLWKGSGEMIDTKFWCRLCALLHEADNSGFTNWYPNLREWWSGPTICIRDFGSTRLTWNQHFELIYGDQNPR